jgi:hypothetical protein
VKRAGRFGKPIGTRKKSYVSGCEVYGRSSGRSKTRSIPTPK